MEKINDGSVFAKKPTSNGKEDYVGQIYCVDSFRDASGSAFISRGRAIILASGGALRRSKREGTGLEVKV